MAKKSTFHRLLVCVTVVAASLLAVPVLAGPAQAAGPAANDTATGVAGNHLTVNAGANDGYPTDGSVTFQVDNQSDFSSTAFFDDPASGVLSFTALRSGPLSQTVTYGVYDTDTFDLLSSATVTFTLTRAATFTPVNDTITLAPGDHLDLDLGANDSGLTDSDVWNAGFVDSAHGSLFIGERGVGTYDATSVTTTPEVLTYEIQDNAGAHLASETLTINVKARSVNVQNDTFTAYAGETTDLDVVANDTGALATDYITTSAASTGSQVFESDNHHASFYANAPGTYTFHYTLSTQNGDPLGAANVTVTVSPLPAVFARKDFADAEVHTPTVVDVLDNDNYPDAGSPVVTIVTAPAHGTVAVSADALPHLTYTPAAGYTGPDTLRYRLTVGADHSDADVDITVSRAGVSRLLADPVYGGAVLHWTNPASPDLSSVVVRYAAGSVAPATPTSGTGVTLSSPTATSASVSGLTNGTQYSFSVWARYAGPIDVGPEETDVVPDLQGVDHLVGEGLDQSVRLDWKNSPGVQNVAVRYATGTYPTASTGTAVTVPAGAETVSIPGLTNGTTYYFRVVASGNGRTADQQLLTATPRATNTAPKAVDDVVSWYGESSIGFDPTNNDDDADSDALTIVGWTQPTNGHVDCSDGFGCTYDAGPGSYTTDTFTYTVSDGHGGRSSATVKVVRRSPFAAHDDYVSAPAYDTTQLDVLANDTGDLPTDNVSFESGGFFSYGSIFNRVGPDGTTQYVFRSNGTLGTFAVDYTVFDENFNNRLGSGRLIVTVGPAKPVTAVDDTYFLERNTVNPLSVVGNDRWTGTPAPTLSVLRQPDHGSLTVDTSTSPAKLVYTPRAGYTGPDSAVYQATQGANSDTAIISMSVDASGLSGFRAIPGIGQADLAWTNPKDSTFDHVALRYTSGPAASPPATPTEGTALPVAATAQSLHWTGLTNGTQYVVSGFAVYSDGSYIRRWDDFVPGIGAVTRLDGDAGNASATLRWTSPTGMTGSTIRYAVGSTCPTTTSQGSGGVVTSTTAATVTVPGLVNGTTYCFAVFAQGGAATSAARTISLTPRATNTSPNAVDDAATLDENGFKEIAVSANDTDPESDPLFLLNDTLSYTQPAHGDVDCFQVGATYSCDYDPAYLFHGTDSFTYTISDRHGGRDTATVNVTVNSVNQPPDVLGETLVAYPGEAAAVNVKANDSDPEAGPLTYAVTTAPGHGTATCTTAGACTYTANAGYLGHDSFVYTVTDNAAKSDTGVVSIDVVKHETAPLAKDDTASASGTTPVTVNVLANDTDADGDPLTIIGNSGASHGTVTCTTSCTYTSADDGKKVDSFTYTISDGHDGVSTATVIVNVSGANHPPVATDDAMTVHAGHAATKNVVSNDTDPDGDSLTATVLAQGTHGTATCSGTSCTYTATSNSFTGSDSFTYTVKDAALTDVGQVNVTIVANAAPVAVDDTATVPSGGTATTNVVANDTDGEGDTLTAAVKTQPAHGTVTCSAGSCTYTSVAPYNGADSYQYTVSDGHGGTAAGTVAVTVQKPAAVLTVKAAPSPASVKGSTVISGTAGPVANGDPINLQRLSGSTWSTIATVNVVTATTSAPYSFVVKQTTSASYSYRVVAPAAANHSEGTSPTVVVGFYAVSMPTVVKKGNEYVVVKNTGTVSFNIKGWTITTKAKKVLTLPSKTLAAGKSVKIHPGSGTTTATDIYLRRGASFNDAHDKLVLKNAQKVVVATKSY